MFSLTPDGKPGRPKTDVTARADRAPCSTEPAPCAPQAHALAGRDGGPPRVLGLPIERLERDRVDARRVTIRGQAQMPGVKPAVLPLPHEHWRRQGSIV
jgi:hypothetical protein